jgi:small redox-active disulfide protein 2
MQIKVLGSGCSTCAKLEERTHEALGQLGMEAEVVKVEDIAQVMSYGLMATPGLVIDEQLVMSGRLPDVDELAGMISSAASGESAKPSDGGCNCADGCC